MTATAHDLPMVLDVVEIVDVHRLSPSFVRLELGGDCLADFGVEGTLRDQRFKLVLPAQSGELSDFSGADASWFASWLDVPAEQRGHMRTYTIRDVRGTGRDTRLVVDVVLHGDEDGHGPGSRWAHRARPGDRLIVLAPRAGEPFGGVEFEPGDAHEVLLVGDETAVPAIAGILRDLPRGMRGTAFLEVPVEQDFLDDVIAPAGVELVWLARGDAEHGDRLRAAVLAQLGVPGSADPAVDPESEPVDPDLWETPTHSSSGEQLDAGAPAPTAYAGLYAWIAGEAAMVTGLRRHLVRELRMPRRQVAFMGYWRRGVAMRS